ncbi:DUF4142 domain-containing protein [Pontibacter ruber]|uniref:DUF4142 domain-containing protein n=1 Tax=Pontibacter ruber TaxID=1343895 RepID=A0ABW5D264_9BACT|nr:DUF4142 domain-containing protein [Pontibacter ruber]
MKKTFFYFVAGTMFTATACSTTDTATADSTSLQTSETTTAAGSAADETTTDTNTGTMGSTGTTGSTGTSETMSSSGSTGTTGTTGTMSSSGTSNATGATGAAGSGGTTGTGSDMGTTGDVATLTNIDDATFMMTAASSNMLEIQLGKMAAAQASDPKVKEFAQMMVDHHTKATQELKTVASQMGVTLPTTLMPMHQAMVDKLSGKTGTALDEDYMDTMESAHKMDIAMFEAKSTNAKSSSVKTFATKTLPKLQSHQKMATSIEDTVD